MRGRPQAALTLAWRDHFCQRLLASFTSANACAGSISTLVTVPPCATSVACVDCDGEACELAERLIALMGLQDRIAIVDIDAETYPSEPDETIICASLLRAPDLFTALQDRRTRRLIVRDAEGPYRFCYRPALLPGGEFVERAKSPLSSGRINTSRYFEARVRGADLAAFRSDAYLLS